MGIRPKKKKRYPVFGFERMLLVNVAAESNDVVFLGAEGAEELRPEIIAAVGILVPTTHIQICNPHTHTHREIKSIFQNSTKKKRQKLKIKKESFVGETNGNGS